MEFAVVSAGTKIRKNSTDYNISWQKPRDEWHKLNTDGAVNEEQETAGIGIPHNCGGNWVRGSACNNGEASTLLAETYVPRHGIILTI